MTDFRVAPKMAPASHKENDGSFYHVDDDHKPSGRPETLRSFTLVDSVALAAAEAKQKPSPWSKNMLKLYLVLLVPALWSCSSGFIQNVETALYNDERFADFIGATPSIRFLQGSTYVASIVGYIFAAPLLDWKGNIFKLTLLVHLLSLCQPQAEKPEY